MRIESTARFTECVCGKVGRVEENRTSCFYLDRIDNQNFESKVVLKTNEVCYWAAINDECPQMSAGLIQVNASIQIQYNDTVQTYIYKPTNASTSYSLVTQVGTSGYYKYCFQDSSSLKTISKRVPLQATITINTQQRGVAIKMTSSTKRVQIEDSIGGFDQTTAFVQQVEIQTYGTISDVQSAALMSIINSTPNPRYFSYISVFSKRTNLAVYGYSDFTVWFQNNTAFYISRLQNPDLPVQIQQIKAEDLSDLVIHWNIFVSDQQNNVLVSYRKQISSVKFTCVSHVKAIWNSQTQITVQITPINDNCHQIQPVKAIIGFINNTQDIVYPGFVAQINDYSSKTSQIVLTTTNTSLKEQIDSAIYNQFILMNENGYVENIEINDWLQLKVNQIKQQIQILSGCMGATVVYTSCYYLIKFYTNKIKGQAKAIKTRAIMPIADED
ncbi:Hypothetical_protein [Hexamita inflata]|uniref:Hypothetical_protein n=1 Tax=Hexamita inflata TaxID=28002 RepID=A0AA86TZH0_9EUKA|nr:Hypothetical protein HINF_LOCUS20462 [Hexamita inflata]